MDKGGTNSHLQNLLWKTVFLIFSDEIHADIIMKDHRFCFGWGPSPMRSAKISSFLLHLPKLLIWLALGASIIVIPNEELRKKMAKRMLINRYPASNVFGPIAGRAAYLYGDDYADELVPLRARQYGLRN